MKKHITLQDESLCSGCGVCYTVCPVHAIEMSHNEEGYDIPCVNEDICINCGKCLNCCHLQSSNRLAVYPMREQYAAKMLDEKRRMRSRSGGVFALVSDAILERGGIVYGAVLNGVSDVLHIRATTKKERDWMCGSKYVQSRTADIYYLLKKDVEQGEIVLFTGSPCQVAAAAKMFGKEYDNLYLMDFVCHGVPSPMVWKDYLNWASKKYKRIITSVDFRDKRLHSWESHVECITMGNKQVMSRRYTNIFSSNNCLRRSCYQCPYTSIERNSDFTIGDYWGIDQVVPNMNDQKGISLLIIRSEKGSLIFDEVRQQMEIFDTSAYEPIHYNLKRPTACPQTRDAFWADYKKHGFEYVTEKYGRYDLLHRIKYKLIDKID